MARPPKPHSSFLSDALIFASGALLAILLLLALSSLRHQPPLLLLTPSYGHPGAPKPHPDDPSEPTFYDDPSLSYAIDSPVADWDAKRRRWLRLHPSLSSSGAGERVVMVSGSQPSPCRNSVGTTSCCGS
uniref:Uncharacterized protein n=1 Tax=Ananas comosus var. bracteatus TaxID=296719 RepID=A0A6V7PNJ7_ANACO|nr:unnamed protein product [Ananas comosus var. bracteatus]